MKSESLSFDGVNLQEGSEVFVDNNKVREFYDYLENETKDTFRQLETARKKSNDLAMKKYIG